MNRGHYKFRTTEIAAFVAFSFGELFSTIWLISYLVGSKPNTFPLLEQGAFANEIAYWGVQIVAILTRGGCVAIGIGVARGAVAIVVGWIIAVFFGARVDRRVCVVAIGSI